MHEIELPEFDHTGQFGAHPHQSGIGTTALEKPSTHACFVEPLVGTHRIDRSPRGLKNIGIDIRRDDADLGPGAERLERGHRDRPRLFAARRGSAPDPHRTGLHPKEIGQQRKVIGLAEKRGEIGGERIEKRLPERRIGRLDRIKQAAVVGQPMLAQDASEPPLHHALLARQQMDPGSLLDDPTGSFEVARRQRGNLTDCRCCSHEQSSFMGSGTCSKLFPIIVGAFG